MAFPLLSGKCLAAPGHSEQTLGFQLACKGNRKHLQEYKNDHQSPG